MPKRALVSDQKTGVILGMGCYLLGSLLLWDAYERRGRGRPAGMRWLPNA